MDMDLMTIFTVLLGILFVWVLLGMPGVAQKVTKGRCPNCGSVISYKARICPHCWYNVGNSMRFSLSGIANPRSKRGGCGGKLVLILVLALLVVIVIMSSGVSTLKIPSFSSLPF